MASPSDRFTPLAITDPKWVRAYILEADLGRIKPGMSRERDYRQSSRPERSRGGLAIFHP